MTGISLTEGGSINPFDYVKLTLEQKRKSMDNAWDELLADASRFDREIHEQISQRIAKHKNKKLEKKDLVRPAQSEQSRYKQQVSSI